MTARRTWGRWLLFAAAALFAWAGIVTVTGGLRIDIGPIRISSRDAGRVIVLGLLAAVAAWHLAYRDSLVRLFRRAPSTLARLDAFARLSLVRFERAPALLAWGFAAAVLVCGVKFGSRVAGGADAFGYVSASALWRSRALGIDQHVLANLPWPSPAIAFVPLAYRLGTDGVMGPTVAPGLPLLMALARTISVCGPYLIAPLCGSLLVLATFELGRRLFNTGTALVAAALVACSPVTFFQSLVVMADIPAAAFWTSALAAASSARARGALFSGALAGGAILIRPNLTPLAIFPWLLIVRRNAMPAAVRRSALFALFSVPAALFVAWVNRRLFGSPLSSGYGDVGAAFAIAHAGENVRLYAQWWLESQGWTAFLFLAGLWRRRPNHRDIVILIAYAACAVLLYVFYLPFDQWWYLRFLAPAIPIVFLLCADAIDWVTASSPSLRALALTGLVVIAASHAFTFIASKDILVNSAAERRRYLDAARYVDATTPSDAVVLAMQHSGSVRYYAGRLTMRWDVLDPSSLDAAVAALGRRGTRVFALLEPWEEQDFRRRFAHGGTLNALRTPLARTASDDVRLYALDSSSESTATVLMPPVDVGCLDASPRFVYPDALRRLTER